MKLQLSEDVRKNNYLRNRDRKHHPRKRKFWCGKCDGTLLNGYNKCWNCGFRNSTKRFKK